MRSQSTLCQAHTGRAALGAHQHTPSHSTPANLSCILGVVWMGKGRSLRSLMGTIMR